MHNQAPIVVEKCGNMGKVKVQPAANSTYNGGSFVASNLSAYRRYLPASMQKPEFLFPQDMPDRALFFSAFQGGKHVADSQLLAQAKGISEAFFIEEAVERPVLSYRSAAAAREAIKHPVVLSKLPPVKTLPKLEPKSRTIWDRLGSIVWR